MSDAPHNAEPGRSDPFTRAYRWLRQDIASGTSLPGDQIVVIEAARRLAISPTPVREALARLSGERLVEDRRRHGYFVPLLSWFDLINLYDLCEMHVLAAIRQANRERVSGVVGAMRGGETPTSPDPLANIFTALLDLSRNARLVLAGRGFVDCLGAARRAEVILYGIDEARTAQLRALVETGAWKETKSVVQGIFRTHRRRAEPVAYAMAEAHRAKNRANIV